MTCDVFNIFLLKQIPMYSFFFSVFLHHNYKYPLEEVGSISCAQEKGIFLSAAVIDSS